MSTEDNISKKTPIIIVTHDKFDQFLLPCIDAIITNTIQPYRIILIDSGSELDANAFLKRNFVKHCKNIDLLRYARNIGWFEGNLNALLYIRNLYNYEHFCLLNNDTVVSKNWLSKLSMQLEDHDNAVTIIPTEKIIKKSYIKRIYNYKISKSAIVEKILSSKHFCRIRGKGYLEFSELKPECNKCSLPEISKVNELNAKIEKRHYNVVKKLNHIGSGYCILCKKCMEEYFIEFFSNPKKYYGTSNFWENIQKNTSIHYLRSNNTYVYHHRKGSGGYTIQAEPICK